MTPNDEATIKQLFSKFREELERCAHGELTVTVIKHGEIVQWKVSTTHQSKRLDVSQEEDFE